MISPLGIRASGALSPQNLKRSEDCGGSEAQVTIPILLAVTAMDITVQNRRIKLWVSEASGVLAAEKAMTIGAESPSVPRCPGLYAIHASAAVWLELGLGDPPDKRMLYVGKSESSLAGRDIGSHFGYSSPRRSTSVTGYSTLRRSIAALLHDNLGFQGVPRNPANVGHYSNFGLTREQDELLSEWMRKRLTLACWPKPDNCGIKQLEDVERAIFRRLQPPLNLKDLITPWKSQIDSVRRVMATEARERGPAR